MGSGQQSSNCPLGDGSLERCARLLDRSGKVCSLLGAARATLAQEREHQLFDERGLAFCGLFPDSKMSGFETVRTQGEGCPHRIDRLGIDHAHTPDPTRHDDAVGLEFIDE